MFELTMEQKQVRQSHYTRTFSWMFIGVLVTGIVSYLIAASGILFEFLRAVGATGYMILSFGLLFAQLAVAANFTRKISKTDASKLKVQFLFYAMLLGVSLSSIFLVYEIGSIATAFLFAAMLFGSLVLVGSVLKMDLTKYSSYFFGALIALIGITVFSYFINFPQEDLIIGVLGVIIFMGITVYDVQKMNKFYNRMFEEDVDIMEAQTMGERYSIYFAFSLYLDFINLFIYILRILNRRD